MQQNLAPDPSDEQEFFVSRYAVKTALYEQLKSALAERISPLFVTGMPGSGKTTVLQLLEHDWSASGKLTCLVPLQTIYRESDLISSLQHCLLGSEAIPQGHRPVVVRSSGSEALHSIVDLIRSLPSKPLILLDGLDETRNPELILSFVRLISEDSNTLVVVTGRTSPPESAGARVFKHILTTQAFTRSDIMELIKLVNPRLELNDAQLGHLYELIHGSPLMAR